MKNIELQERINLIGEVFNNLEESGVSPTLCFHLQQNIFDKDLIFYAGDNLKDFQQSLEEITRMPENKYELVVGYIFGIYQGHKQVLARFQFYLLSTLNPLPDMTMIHLPMECLIQRNNTDEEKKLKSLILENERLSAAYQKQLADNKELRQVCSHLALNKIDEVLTVMCNKLRIEKDVVTMPISQEELNDLLTLLSLLWLNPNYIKQTTEYVSAQPQINTLIELGNFGLEGGIES